MSKPRTRLKRFVGCAIVAAIWGALFGLLGFFGVVYAIYADLQASDRSRLTAGTSAEFIAHAIYDHFRSPTGTVPDPELVYVPRPGSHRHRAPEFDIIATTTPGGMRQQSVDSSNERDLILMVGDSFMMGQGVSDAQTFSSLLQARGHPTVNSGVISYGTARELTRLRRLNLLEKASMLVIQFCSNDGRENSDFVLDPKAPFARLDPSQTWVVKNKYQQSYSELTYANVLNAIVRYLRHRVEEEGVRQTIRELAGSRHDSLGQPIRTRDNRSGEVLAADFLGVLDLFPELAGKPIIVIELNARGSSTGFTEALRRKAQKRTNLQVVDFAFHPEDFFRFDGHLTPHGHEVVAVGLDQAIRRMRGGSPAR